MITSSSLTLFPKIPSLTLFNSPDAQYSKTRLENKKIKKNLRRDAKLKDQSKAEQT